MSDIKSALQQALDRVAATRAASPPIGQLLDEWAEESKPETTMTQAASTKKNLFQTTVGVSQASFNYIRDNPYTTTMQAVAVLEQQGFKRGSTLSLYSQMVRQGLLSKDMDGKLTALVKEFRPMKSSSQMAKISKLVKKVSTKKAKPKAKAAPSRTVYLPSEPVNRAPPERQAPTVNITRHKAPEGIATLNAAVAQATPKLLTAAQVLETLSIKEAHILYRELQTMFG